MTAPERTESSAIGLVVVGAASELATDVLAMRPTGVSTYLYDRVADPNRAYHGCDVEDPVAVEAMLDALPLKSFDHWLFLSTVGLYDGGAGWNGDWASLRRSLAVNLVGVAHAAASFAHRLVSAGASGRVVVVGSAAARAGSLDVGYGTAKAGLEGLVRSLSKVYAARGVTALGVAPGVFDSAMSRQQTDVRRQTAAAATHLRRPMERREVAEVVRYALFAAPDALTGAFIPANGGQT
jgi:NAD(P)-dependent dehydrogenase (short-subunit alcohol dehydrogenase family)